MPTPHKRPAATSARNADRHALYEIAVQRPSVMIGFIEELADVLLETTPAILREDFCGTANLAAAWVASGTQRQAIGVDRDAKVLAWAERRNQRPLGERADRLTLIHDDVMRVRGRRADVIASLNFSHFIFHQRRELLAYLKHARANLKPRGLIVLDTFGGPGSIQPCLDARKFSDFDYLWEQVRFDPVTGRIDCRIHFRFPNGTVRRNAFRYDWRMWTLPEMVDLLDEAGFSEVGVYFESEEGFIDEVDPASCDAWVAYIVGLKRRGERA